MPARRTGVSQRAEAVAYATDPSRRCRWRGPQAGHRVAGLAGQARRAPAAADRR